MKNIQLARNFKLSEFTKEDPNEYQLALLALLARNLQTVRDKLQQYAVKGKSVGINITSGVRTAADYDRLKAKGYNPSRTSDHFCGLQLLAKPTVGAADLTFTNCSLTTRQIAARIVEWDKDNSTGIDLGQVIYEYNPRTGANWVHVSNDWHKVFSEDVAAAVDSMRKKYLMSLDNGKTYVPFEEK